MNVRAATPEERLWLVERVGCHLTADARGILAEHDGTIRAMVVFDWWTENSAEAHVCVEDPRATLPLLHAAMRYFFGQTGRNVLLGRVRASHEKALALDKAVGFHETYRIRDGYAVGEDIVLLELRKEHCRWVKEPHYGH